MKMFMFLLLFACSCSAQEYAFPSDFQFGVATAAYQVEGGWNLSGKGENIWDRLTQTRSYLIADGSNGNIACDTYHKAIEDVELLKSLGVNYYRFSLSWSRLLPTGQLNYVNPDGIRYYNELIDELLANGIEPFVTMFHWDLPQPLHELGGWPSEQVADYFVDYATLNFNLFGDRVKNWLTFNEPMQICEGGYNGAHKAPAIEQPGIGCYLCGHTVLLAHARAYQVYNERFRQFQGGRVGITIDSGWYEPETDSPEDIAAANQVIQTNYGWFAHPIFSTTGDYPAVMKERIAQRSAQMGFPRSRLPEFTPEQIELLRGSSDFLGLNHYTSHLCSPIPPEWDIPTSHWSDGGALCHQPDEWETSASEWLRVAPWGFRRLLNWIKENYNDPEVIVTENGFSDWGQLDDCRRINYYNSYLEQLLLAIHVDGVNVTGYTAWSFMDNFEWMQGFTEKFGLYFVDFYDPDRPRTPKQSSFAYRNILETRQIDWNFTPEGFQPCVW